MSLLSEFPAALDSRRFSRHLTPEHIMVYELSVVRISLMLMISYDLEYRFFKA